MDDLYRAAEDFQRLGIEVLGISGGDGTNGVTITGFLDVYRHNALPQIAFLRGGTMNTVADAVGVRRDVPEGLLGRLIRAYAARASRPLANTERHVMKLHGERSPRVSRTDESTPPLAEKYGFLFGTGAVHGFLAEYYRGGLPSPLVAAKTLLRGAASAAVGGEMVRRMCAPFHGSVEFADGTRWPERDYFAIAGGTIDQIGLNFRPFRRCQEKQGTFHVLGIHTTPMGFVSQLPRLWRAAPMRPEHTFEALASALTIRSPRDTIAYMIDGDLHECQGALHVAVGPKVRIVVGI